MSCQIKIISKIWVIFIRENGLMDFITPVSVIYLPRVYIIYVYGREDNGPLSGICQIIY